MTGHVPTWKLRDLGLDFDPSARGAKAERLAPHWAMLVRPDEQAGWLVAVYWTDDSWSYQLDFEGAFDVTRMEWLPPPRRLAMAMAHTVATESSSFIYLFLDQDLSTAMACATEFLVEREALR